MCVKIYDTDKAERVRRRLLSICNRLQNGEDVPKDDVFLFQTLQWFYDRTDEQAIEEFLKMANILGLLTIEKTGR